MSKSLLLKSTNWRLVRRQPSHFPLVSLPRTILRRSIPDLAAASGRPKKTQPTRRATLAPPPRQSAVSHQQTSDPWFPRCER